MNRVCPKCGIKFESSVFFCGHDGTITIEEQDASDFDPRLGNQLGEYVVVARVADGAMGRVYEGRHSQTKARVAIKVLHSDVAEDPVSVERFRQEFQTTQSFDHPNIVKVIDFGDTADGSYFMTMEYLVGEELSQMLKREGRQSPARALRLVCQLVQSLQHAHSFGVVHRDLKPDNIFVCPSEHGDVVRILDFGSVKLQMSMGPKLTAIGTTLGSPYYMSPEQAMGKFDVDQRTDVFALSAIVYELATGKVAFDGDNVADILTKIVQYAPPSVHGQNADYPKQIDEVIDRGIQKDKLERFSSVSEFCSALLRALGLAGDAAQWANASVEKIQSALVDAIASDPTPTGPRADSWLAPERVSSVPPLLMRSSGPRWHLWAGLLVIFVSVCWLLFFG